MTPYFRLTKAKNGEYYFTLYAGNGKPLGKSDTYKAKASAIHGIEVVRREAVNPDRFVYKSAPNGKTYLSLKAGNGEIMLTGRGYTSEDGAKAGADNIASAAKTLDIWDAT